ncbi:MAG: hypothetical protein WBA10_15070 [Elainellaceae cyanobacterium]
MELLIDTRFSPTRRFKSDQTYQGDRFIVEVTTTTNPGKVGLLQAIASVDGINDVEVARLAVVGNQRLLFEVPPENEVQLVFELSDWVPIQVARLRIWGQPVSDQNPVVSEEPRTVDVTADSDGSTSSASGIKI